MWIREVGEGAAAGTGGKPAALCSSANVHRPCAYLSLQVYFVGSPWVAYVDNKSVASLTPALFGGAQGSKPDYLYLLQRMCMDNPEAAVGLAKSVARQPGPPIELNTLADVFLQRNMVREATAFLLDVLQGDDPAHDKLQTKARARAWL